MKASEIKTITKVSLYNDEDLKKARKIADSIILEKAQEGKQECCWYAIWHNIPNRKKDDLQEKLKNSLINDGYKIMKGIDLGKAQGSWYTPFVIW